MEITSNLPPTVVRLYQEHCKMVTMNTSLYSKDLLPSSCLLPERIIVMIGPFSFCRGQVHKCLLKAPAWVWNVCPCDKKQRRSWSPWAGFTVSAFRGEIIRLDMCWIHCRDAGSAPAVSPHEKTRDLIHLNRFLICGDDFFFSSLELRNLNLLLKIGTCCREEEEAAMIPSRSF